MGTLARFFKDTVIYGIAAVLPRAINILLVKLHTLTLSAATFAINTDYYVYAAYFNALLTYGMETAFFRFFSKEKNKTTILSTSFISLVVTSLIFLLVLLFFSDAIAYFFGFTSPIFFKLLVWTITLDTLVVIPYAYLRVTNKPKLFTAYKLLNIGVFAGLNVFFLWYIPYAISNEFPLPQWLIDYNQSIPKVMHIFVAGTVASAVSFIVLFPLVFKLKGRFDWAVLKKMLHYSLPIMVGSLAFVTNENLDKLLLGNMIGKASMGTYAACYKLGVFMTLYIMAFRLGAEPFFFNQATKKNAPETYAKIMTWFTILGSFFMLFIVLFIDVFASLLIGREEYLIALPIVPLILLANLFLGIYNNLSVWYKLTDQTRFGMYFSLIGAGVTIGLNLLLIPSMGYLASALATVAAYGLMMVLSYWIGKDKYPIPYALSKILKYLLITLIFSAISFRYFRENYWISTLMVLSYLVWVYVSEKATIQQIRNR